MEKFISNDTSITLLSIDEQQFSNEVHDFGFCLGEPGWPLQGCGDGGLIFLEYKEVVQIKSMLELQFLSSVLEQM